MKGVWPSVSPHTSASPTLRGRHAGLVQLAIFFCVFDVAVGHPSVCRLCSNSSHVFVLQQYVSKESSHMADWGFDRVPWKSGDLSFSSSSSSSSLSSSSSSPPPLLIHLCHHFFLLFLLHLHLLRQDCIALASLEFTKLPRSSQRFAYLCLWRTSICLSVFVCECVCARVHTQASVSL